MPKLNNIYFDEIAQQLRQSKNKEKNLEKFMLSGKECHKAGIKCFIKNLKPQKIVIEKNRWQFFAQTKNHGLLEEGGVNALWPASVFEEKKYTLIYDFNEFVFIKELSSSVLSETVIEMIDKIELKSPNEKCFPFLKQVKNLTDLTINCHSTANLGEIFSNMSNIKEVENFTLNVPGVDSRVLNSIAFKYSNLEIHKFIFENILNLTPRNYVQSVKLFNNEKSKKAIIFEVENFMNYFNAFPKAKFEFKIHHKISDGDLNALNIFKDHKELDYKEAYIEIIYYNFDHSNMRKSKIYKKLETLLPCIGIYPFQPPKYRGNGYKFFITYDYPNLSEYVASRWNSNEFYYPEGKKHIKKCNPEDVIQIQTKDLLGNVVDYKVSKDMATENFFKFYETHMKAEHGSLRYIANGKQIEYYRTFRKYNFKINDRIFIVYRLRG